MRFCARSKALRILERGGGNRPLVFSLEVGKFPQCFQVPFRHFAAFWAIEIATEFLFVGMVLRAAGAIPSSMEIGEV